VKKTVDNVYTILIIELFFSISFYLFIPLSFHVPGLISFSLTKVLAVANLLVYALLVIIDKKASIQRAVIFIAITAVIGIISALFTDMKVENVRAAMNFSAGVAILIAVNSALKKDPKMKEYAYAAIIVCGIIEIAAAGLEFISGNKLDFIFKIFSPPGTYDSILNMTHDSGFLNDTNHFAGYLSFFLMLIAGLFFLKNRSKPVIAATALVFIIGCQTLISTYSRSSIGALMVAIILTIFMTWVFSDDKVQKNRSLFLIVIFLTLLIFNFSAMKGLQNHFIDVSGSEKGSLKKAAISMEAKNMRNLLIGPGYATYERKIHNDPEYTFPGIIVGMSESIVSPHSVYNEIMLASGILGLISFLIFGILIASWILKLVRSRNIEALTWLALFAGWADSGLLEKDLYVIPVCNRRIRFVFCHYGSCMSY
jgi:hypothetical protein